MYIITRGVTPPPPPRLLSSPILERFRLLTVLFRLLLSLCCKVDDVLSWKKSTARDWTYTTSPGRPPQTSFLKLVLFRKNANTVIIIPWNRAWRLALASNSLPRKQLDYGWTPNVDWLLCGHVALDKCNHSLTEWDSGQNLVINQLKQRYNWARRNQTFWHWFYLAVVAACYERDICIACLWPWIWPEWAWHRKTNCLAQTRQY